MEKREELDLTKITFITFNQIVSPDSTPYSPIFNKLILSVNNEAYEKHEKGKCHLFTGYFQYHVWNYGEIPSYDKMKEYVGIKTDKTFNKYIAAINKHNEWVSEIYIKQKWKTRFKKMHLTVKGGK
jgi:hypothetical protein